MIWVILGIAMCVGAIKLQLGSFRAPGPGFLPFLTGGALGIFGLILTAGRLFAREKGREQAPLRWDWRRSRAPLLALVTLLAYIVLLEPLGFLLTTFACLAFLFKLSEPRKWMTPLVLSGVTSVVSYLLFSVWLQGQFPRGVLKFW